MCCHCKNYFDSTIVRLIPKLVDTQAEQLVDQLKNEGDRKPHKENLCISCWLTHAQSLDKATLINLLTSVLLEREQNPRMMLNVPDKWQSQLADPNTGMWSPVSVKP